MLFRIGTLSAALTLLLSVNAASQPDSLWSSEIFLDTALGGGSGPLSRLLLTQGGSFIITGQRRAASPPGTDCYAILADSTGQGIWQRRYGGGGGGQFFSNGCLLTSGYNVLVGYYDSQDIAGPYSLVIDSTGEELWSKVWDGLWFTSACATDDGGFMAGGYTVGAHGHTDIYVVNLDGDYDAVWEHTYGVDDISEYPPRNIIRTADGGFAFGSLAWDGEQGDLMLVKIDADGNEDWKQYYEYEGYQIKSGAAIAQLADGGFFLQSSVWAIGDDDLDIYVVRTDSAGQELWSRTYGSLGKDDISNILIPSSGGLLLAGTTEMHGEEGWKGERPYLLRLDDDGQELWHMILTFDHFYGPHAFTGVVATSDGGYAAAGTGYAWDRWWLFKTGPDPIQPNRAPDPFDLVAPEDNYTISSPDSALLFDWADASDPDSDTVRYILYLQHIHPDSARIQLDVGDSSFTERQMAQVMIASGLWPQFADTTVVFSWWVEASDGVLTTPSLSCRTLSVPPPEEIPDSDFILHPSSFILSAYPNPFNSGATVSFTLPGISSASWSILNSAGQLVQRSSPRRYKPGRYSIVVNAPSWPSGVYLVRLETGYGVRLQRMVKVR